MIQSSLFINSSISVPISEFDFSAIRAEGPGGQHVNKTSSAVVLRFNIAASSLPESVKSKLFTFKHRYITNYGEVVINAQDHRSLIRNKEEALERFKQLLLKVLFKPKKRKPTKPKKSAVEKRIKNKKKRGYVKKLRGKVIDGE